MTRRELLGAIAGAIVARDPIRNAIVEIPKKYTMTTNVPPVFLSCVEATAHAIGNLEQSAKRATWAARDLEAAYAQLDAQLQEFLRGLPQGSLHGLEPSSVHFDELASIDV